MRRTVLLGRRPGTSAQPHDPAVYRGPCKPRPWLLVHKLRGARNAGARFFEARLSDLLSVARTPGNRPVNSLGVPSGKAPGLAHRYLTCRRPLQPLGRDIPAVVHPIELDVAHAFR